MRLVMSVHLDKKLYLVASLCDAVLDGAPGPSACQKAANPLYVNNSPRLVGISSVGITPSLAFGDGGGKCYQCI